MISMLSSSLIKSLESVLTNSLKRSFFPSSREVVSMSLISRTKNPPSILGYSEKTDLLSSSPDNKKLLNGCNLNGISPGKLLFYLRPNIFIFNVLWLIKIVFYCCAVCSVNGFVGPPVSSSFSESSSSSVMKTTFPFFAGYF